MENQQELDSFFMKRCIDLALQGEGKSYPNPMVGAVIVHNNKIIGEGFHRKAGEAHAEVIAVNSVKDPRLLKEATIYVSLEPCSHHGKTPPCSTLLSEEKIPRVVVGCVDTFSQVAGRGIEQLRASGAEVVCGVREQECRELNKRFFTFHEKKRPYIILKWAETRDGFLDIDRQAVKGNRPTWITSQYARRAVHLWRSREQAILVGSVTALKDNPGLKVRDWSGAHPLRLVLDRGNTLPDDLALFNGDCPTLLFTSALKNDKKIAERVIVKPGKEPTDAIIEELYNRDIQSLIVEGGAGLLSHFIQRGLWDEARVFVGDIAFGKGVEAPKLRCLPRGSKQFDNSILYLYRNI